jgi:glycosyltransferase involved in cell wall biosynthesis
VDDVSLRGLHAAADLFILVSLYEGFGLPLLEAMASGTPVIASRSTATGETAGEASVRVDPTDEGAICRAIDRVLADAATRAGLIEAGRRWAARFTWEEAARGTLAVYRRVLNSEGVSS